MVREPQMIPMTRFTNKGGKITYFWHLLGAQIVRTAAMPEYKNISNFCLIVTAARHEDIPWFKECSTFGNMYYVPVNPNYDEHFAKFYTTTNTDVPIAEIEIARTSKNPKDFMVIKRVNK